MSASILPRVSTAVRVLTICSMLSLIGLVAGAACVVLPLGTPLAFVATAGGLLLWLMPDLQRVPATMGRRMIYVFVFLNLCIPSYYALIVPGLPWISLRRLSVVLIGVPTTVILAGSSHYRSVAGKVLRSQPLIRGCLIVFLTILAISTLLSIHIGDSLGTVINMVVGWFIPFAACLMLLRSIDDISRMMRLLVWCTLFDFVIGFIEFALRRPFLIYLLPPSVRSQVIEANPLYIVLLQGQGIRNGLYRAASAFNISLSWGEMAAMMTPIALHFLAHGASIRERMFGAIGFVAAFASIVCSGARGGYVSFLAAVIVYALFWALRLIRSRPGSLLGANGLTIIGLGACLVVFSVFFVGPVRGYVLGSGGTQSSNDARWLEWALAKPKVLSSPLWGYGPGMSGDVIGYRPFGSASATVDSYIMTGLVDFGVIGFTALALMVFAAIVTALRHYVTTDNDQALMGNALGCSLIAFVIYRITLSQQENMMTMFIALALVTLLAAQKSVRQSA